MSKHSKDAEENVRMDLQRYTQVHQETVLGVLLHRHRGVAEIHRGIIEGKKGGTKVVGKSWYNKITTNADKA
jgi:hypothetical protein